jgi:putative flippase GtrA
MKALSIRLAKYALVGTAASILHILSALVFYAAADMPPLLANGMAFLMSFGLSFWGNCRWTFASSVMSAAALPRFFALSVACLLLSQSLIYLAMTYMHLSFAFAVTLATVAAATAGFLGSQLWAFANRENTPMPALAFPRPALVAIGALFVLQFIVRAGAQLNHDVAWYLYSAGGILDGAKLYVDIVEVNPPLGIWTFLPVAWLSRAFGLDTGLALATFMLSACAVSLLLLSRILRSVADCPPAFIDGFLILAAFLLLFEPASAFGQREHLLILLTLPWFALRWARGQGATPHAAFAALIGLLAALGFGQKPHCVLAAVFVEGLMLFRARSIRVSQVPENLAGLVAGVLYLLAVSIFTPEFFSHILPLALQAYVPFYGTSAAMIIKATIFWCAALLLAVHVANRCPEPLRSWMHALGLAALGFLLAFLVQAKGFAYHLLPARITIELIFGVAIAALAAGVLKFDQIAAWAKFAAAVCLAVIAGNAVLNPAARYPDFFAQAIAAHSLKPPSVFIASTNVSHGFPLTIEQGLAWGSRFPTQWLAPYAAANLDAEGAPADDLSRFALQATIDDLIRFEPQLVIIDERPKQAYFRAAPLDFQRFWKNDPRFAHLWCNYQLRARERGFSFWERVPDNHCRTEAF